jgi:putative glutathione S-transferase
MTGCTTMSTMGFINRGLLRNVSLPLHPSHPKQFFNLTDTYSTEEAYTKAVTQLFTSLDRLEDHLSTSSTPYLLSAPHPTEADIRLYTTIVRFDPVYVQHFKCNIRDIRSGYPHLHRWMRNLYWDHPAFGETTQFEHIKKHYTRSHSQINKFSITPVGPVPDILPKEKEVPAVEFAGKK